MLGEGNGAGASSAVFPSGRSNCEEEPGSAESDSTGSASLRRESTLDPLGPAHEVILSSDESQNLQMKKHKKDQFESVRKGTKKLQEMLKIVDCEIAIEDLKVAEKLSQVNLTVKPGEMVFFVGPKYQGKKSGCSVLMHVLSGRAYKKGFLSKVSGRAVALGVDQHDGISFDLVRHKSPYVYNKTTIYRKATSLETLHIALINEGFCDFEMRKQILEMLPSEFEGLIEKNTLSARNTQVGDRDVDEGGVEFGRGRCCQHMFELSALERRKLEFVCQFLRTHRPNVTFLVENKELVYFELMHFASFLRGMSTRFQTSMFVRLKQMHGRNWKYCDKLVLMSEKNLLFAGKPDTFERYIMNFSLDVPSGYSPVEFFVDNADPNINPGVDLDAFANEFAVSSIWQEEQDLAHALATKSDSCVPLKRKENLAVTSRWFAQFWNFTKREFRNYIRTAGLTTLRALLYLTMSMLTGIYDVLTSAKDHQFKANHRIWLLMAFFDFSVAASLFGLFALRIERKTLMSEYESERVYLSAWHLGQGLASVPVILFISLPASVTIYFLLELGKANDSFMKFISNFWLLLLIVEGLWTLVALTVNQKRGTTILASFLALAFVLGQGIFTKIANLPANRYVMFISIFRPAMNTFFDSQFSGDDARYFLFQYWRDSSECQISDSNDTIAYSSKFILDCITPHTWSGDCTIKAEQGTLWNGDEVLECLNFVPNSAVVNAISSIFIFLLIRLLAFAINWYQFRRYSF